MRTLSETLVEKATQRYTLHNGCEMWHRELRREGRGNPSLSPRFANEVCGFVRAPSSLVLGNLRIRTQGARAIDSAVRQV